jgi:hypothetical protein
LNESHADKRFVDVKVRNYVSSRGLIKHRKPSPQTHKESLMAHPGITPVRNDNVS